MDFTIRDNNLRVVDSYKINKRDFAETLRLVRELYPNFQVWNRGIPQMCLEWATHNALYSLGISRERTDSCDFEYPQTFWLRAAYAIAGCAVWLFIK